MHYIKSEQYRLFRKKELYQVMLISLGLVIAAIMALYFSLKGDASFPYATNRFLYLNVLTATPLIIVIGMLINRQLLGKDKTVIKQSISFGISRKSIFLTKLMLTILPFFLLCVMGLAIVFMGGEIFLQADAVWRTQFAIAVFNLAPIILSAFIFGNSMMLLISNEIYCIPIVFFIFSSWFTELVKFLENTFLGSNQFIQYLPSKQIEQITNDFLGEKATILPNCWLVGIVIIIVSLLIGIALFDKKDI